MLKLKQLFAIFLALTLAAPLNIKAADEKDKAIKGSCIMFVVPLGVQVAVAAGGLSAAATGLAQLLKAKNPKTVFYSRHDTFGNPLPKGQKRQLTNPDELEAAKTEAKWKAITLIASGLSTILPLTIVGVGAVVRAGMCRKDDDAKGIKEKTLATFLGSLLIQMILSVITPIGLGTTAHVFGSRNGGYSFDGTNIYSRKDLAGNRLKKGHRRLVEPNSIEYRTVLAGKMRLVKMLNTVNAAATGSLAAGAVVSVVSGLVGFGVWNL